MMFPARRLLICGDRNWRNADRILGLLKVAHGMNTVEVVIEGEARGADTLARRAAETLGIPVLRFPADWNTHGKAAGPIRNRQMLKEGQPTEVWAFHNSIETSKGTKDMVTAACAAKIRTLVFRENGTGAIMWPPEGSLF